jgi:hypothetical protein
MDHPVEVDSEHFDLDVSKQLVDIASWIFQQQRTEIEYSYVMSSIRKESLQSLKADWEILVKWCDRFGSTGTKKWPIDVAIISEVEVCGRMYEEQIGREIVFHL